MIDEHEVTSKFLQLKDRLNKAISQNIYTKSTMENTANIYELQKAFCELCELLHELVTKRMY